MDPLTDTPLLPALHRLRQVLAVPGAYAVQVVLSLDVRDGKCSTKLTCV